MPGLAHAAVDGFLDGMHTSVLVSAVVALAGAVVAFVWLPARASYDALEPATPDALAQEGVTGAAVAEPAVATTP